jgi:hypothetical protein
VPNGAARPHRWSPHLVGTAAFCLLLLGCSDDATGGGPQPTDTLADEQRATTDALADEHRSPGGTDDEEPAPSVTTEAAPEPTPTSDDACTLTTRVVEHDDAALNGQLTDRADVAEHAREQARLFDGLAAQLETHQEPRDRTRGRILADTATSLRGIAAVFEQDLGPDGLPIEAALQVDQDLRRLDDVMLDLRLWQAQTCGSGPGVTVGEFEGIPHVHIELGGDGPEPGSGEPSG